MDRDTHEIIRTPDGVDLAVGALPAKNPQAPPVLILHGLASHMGWYRPLARALAGEGLNAYLVDRRGCGLSSGTRGHTDSWRSLVDDVRHVVATLRERHDGAPCHLVGVSLGGVLSLATALQPDSGVTRQVLLAPGLASTIKVPLAKRLRLLRDHLTSPSRAYDIPIDVERLTDCPKWRVALADDELRTRRVTARFLMEFFRMQRFVSGNMARLVSPVLCLLGGDDAVVDNGKVLRILQRARQTAVRTEVFDGAHHVLSASVPAQAIARRIADWFLDPSPRTASPVRVDTGTLRAANPPIVPPEI